MLHKYFLWRMNMKALLLIISVLMMIFVNVIFGFLMLVLVALFVKEWAMNIISNIVIPALIGLAIAGIWIAGLWYDHTSNHNSPNLRCNRARATLQGKAHQLHSKKRNRPNTRIQEQPEMNSTQISAVYLIVSAILLNTYPSGLALAVFIIAVLSFAYFAIKGE